VTRELVFSDSSKVTHIVVVAASCDLLCYTDGLAPFDSPVKVCAVSYLNTSPLVWGMLHGNQRGVFDLDFRVPSQCAEQVSAGAADIGIIPSIELNRHNYGRVRGLGIASRGPVRSILLVSSKPVEKIETLAADISSRTSVALARIILGRRYRVEPRVIAQPPDLRAMLAAADAALIIGDPALHLDPDALDGRVLDLGSEWTEMTGLPMVFAIWAGLKESITRPVEAVFHASYEFGRDHLEEIVRTESAQRGISAELAREYLTRHIVCELGDAEYEGLEFFLACARAARTAAQFDMPRSALIK
jgi:chorismate dehydratase